MRQMGNNILLPLEPGNIGKTIFHTGSKASIKAYPYSSVAMEEPEDSTIIGYPLYTLNEGREITLKGQVLIKVIGTVMVQWGEVELPTIMFDTRNSKRLIFSPARVHTIAGLRPPKIDSNASFE